MTTVASSTAGTNLNQNPRKGLLLSGECAHGSHAGSASAGGGRLESSGDVCVGCVREWRPVETISEGWISQKGLDVAGALRRGRVHVRGAELGGQMFLTRNDGRVISKYGGLLFMADLNLCSRCSLTES